MKGLTEKDIKIFETLKEIYYETKNPVGPTAIGLKYGKDYSSASAYCTTSIRRLMVVGKIEKKGRGYVPTIEE